MSNLVHPRIRRAALGVVAALLASSGLAPEALAVDATAPFGLYPNCNAPSIPIEMHSWFGEPDEEVPRHMHLAACLPNARDTTGELVSVSRPQPFSVRLMAFNNPGAINLVRWAWESSVKEKVPVDLKCQSNPMEMRECTWWVDMTLDPSSSSGGLHELRLTPNISKNDLGNRQYGTLNYQIYLKNGKSGGNYRSKPDPIARTWYTGFDYANVAVNYMDFFKGAADLDKSMPTVSGVVPLRIRHEKGSHTVRSQLWQDVNFHHDPEFWTEAQVGVPSHDGAVLLYKVPGRFDGTYQWDTRGLADGTHVLYFETVDEGSAGFQAGAMKLFFNVQNGGSPVPAGPLPDPHDPHDPPAPGPTDPPAPTGPDPLLQALEDINATTHQGLDGQQDPATALRLVYERARAALGL